LNRWKTVPAPIAVAAAGDRIFASDWMGNLKILDRQAGNVLETYSGLGLSHQITVDSRGDIYLAITGDTEGGVTILRRK